MVGTPGRVIDHIENQVINTSAVKYLVLDEADEMLNMGFIDQVETIIASLPKNHITILLSATMHTDIMDLCNKYMSNPVKVEIEEEDKVADRISQERYIVNETDKMGLLRDLTVVENPDSCIIFCNMKQKVDDVFWELSNLKYTCKKIHGGMEQRDRIKVMEDFKHGYFRYLVATDVVARGIDINNITLVMNYDIPEDPQSYVHRIGRTGRIGETGKAITFMTPNENRYLDDIQRFIEKKIDVKERPMEGIVKDSKEAFIDKKNALPEKTESKGTNLCKDIIKLHVNAGKKTKMRASDIVGTLCNIDGMTKDDIGIINIADISTFVEILNNKGELVYEALQKTPIKGRIRIVSKVGD